LRLAGRPERHVLCHRRNAIIAALTCLGADTTVVQLAILYKSRRDLNEHAHT
jgi:hypothetical protein